MRMLVNWWQIYDEFAPLSMRQFEDRNVMKMDTFDSAMDEFFSKIEGQRADQQRKAQEESAFSKLDKIRADQVSFSFHLSWLIAYNPYEVDFNGNWLEFSILPTIYF